MPIVNIQMALYEAHNLGKMHVVNLFVKKTFVSTDLVTASELNGQWPTDCLKSSLLNF